MPPFIPYRLGSTDSAAKEILDMLNREEREKRELRRLRRTGWRPVPASLPTANDERPMFSDGRDAVADLVQRELDQQRAERIEARRRAQRRGQLAQQAQLAPTSDGATTISELPDYGWPEAIDDEVRGVTRDDYEDYVAVNAAQSEMVASQLPGREDGPADAYRHMLWAAELTRRFGPERARQLLGLHEQDGQRERQSATAGAMDQNNNEIGIALAAGARSWNDVVRAARTVMSRSLPDGSGGWRQGATANATLAPFAAQWLPENQWSNNPKFEPRQPAGVHPPHVKIFGPLTGQEMPTSETNWYANPERPSGPAWIGGYVPDRYRYRYGSASHVTGPEDERMKRAMAAYRFTVFDPLAKLLRPR